MSYHRKTIRAIIFCALNVALVCLFRAFKYMVVVVRLCRVSWANTWAYCDVNGLYSESFSPISIGSSLIFLWLLIPRYYLEHLDEQLIIAVTGQARQLTIALSPVRTTSKLHTIDPILHHTIRVGLKIFAQDWIQKLRMVETASN